MFREFCGNVDCNLFRPQDSYGRKLLYLKDQLKDIDTSASLLDAEVNAAHATVGQYDQAFEAVQQRRRQQVTAKGGDTLASEIEALTREIRDLAVRLDRLQVLDAERTKLANLSNALHKADEEVAAMAAVRGSSGGDRLADARTILGRTCLKWSPHSVPGTSAKMCGSTQTCNHTSAASASLLRRHRAEARERVSSSRSMPRSSRHPLKWEGITLGFWYLMLRGNKSFTGRISPRSFPYARNSSLRNSRQCSSSWAQRSVTSSSIHQSQSGNPHSRMKTVITTLAKRSGD